VIVTDNQKPKKTLKKRTKVLLCVTLPVTFLLLVFIFTPLTIYWIGGDDTTLDFEFFYLGQNGEQNDDFDLNIVHLSDLHFPKYNVDLDELLEETSSKNPDFIAITGDLMDTRGYVATSGVDVFLSNLAAIAPVFYVDGNHDLANSNTQKLHGILRDSGAVVLENQSVTLNIRGNYILVAGLRHGSRSLTTNKTQQELEQIEYTVFLIHSPTFEIHANVYHGGGIYTTVLPNLILSGHVHGGHIRLFNRAILCPDRFFNPPFSNGLYKQMGRHLIVSRGIGNYLFFRRVNNKPHVPVVRVRF